MPMVEGSGSIGGNPTLEVGASAEEAARRALEEQAAVFAHAPVGIAVVGMDGRLVRCNRRLEQIIGYSEAELRLAHFEQFTHSEDIGADVLLNGELVAGKRESYNLEKRYLRKDGELVWAELAVSLIRNAAGAPVQAIVIVTDITGRKQAEGFAAERELSASREKLKMALVAARAGIWSWDAGSGEVQWSPELELIHGLEPGTFEGSFEAATRDVHPSDRDAFSAAVGQAMEGGGSYGVTYRIVRPDGALRWVEAVGAVVHDADGNATGLTGVCRDVTQRMLAEQARRESEERFKALFESSALGVSLIDLDNRFVEVNETFATLLGCDRADLVGRDYRELIVEADELDKAHRQRGELLAGERDAYSCELHLLVRDGSLLPVRGWVSLVPDGDGAPRYTIAAIASMAEQRALEEQVRQTQKMDAIGQLAGGIAHDFNNLLGVIAVQAERLLDRGTREAEETEALLDISQAADRGAQLTRRLLTFSRREPVRLRLLDLDDVVAGLQRMLARLIGAEVELAWELDPGPKLVRADVGQLEQVVVNLVVNARDALPAGGRIATATRAADLAADDATGLPAGRYVILSVSDDGVGIEPHNLARIFEPFFTTKEAERGTGLGLTTVYGIVQGAGGTITVDTEVGRGTTFTVYLPRVEKPADHEPVHGELEPTPPAALVQARAARVLLVEDDESMLRLGEAVLSDAGFDVRPAQGAAEALALLEQDKRLDLLVTDVSMPVMSGKDLAAAVRRLVPEVPVLYVTGYDRGILAAGTSEGERSDVIQKPFAIGELRTKAAALLADGLPMA